MCYHYSLTKKQEEILRMIEAEWELPFEPIHHVTGFEFPMMPVITIEQPSKVQGYHWGLIPHWVKSVEDAKKLRAQTLNAKAETLFEKPSFRSYTANRCLVLADGFFEWMDHNKKKYPHYIHLKENQLFAFAGLYAHWVDKETGQLLQTFTIITTDANPLVERIHNVKKRMPVILFQDDWHKWLDKSLTKDEMIKMMQPCPDTNMQAYTISKRITGHDDKNVPEVHEQFTYDELQSGEQFSLFNV